MKLNFFGDISLYNISFNKFEFCNRFNKLVDSADYNIGNLECPITNNDTKEDNQAVNMSASPQSISLLKSFELVSLANNHVRDFKNEGIEDTIEILKKANIGFFGIGKTQKEAIKPVLLEKDCFKIAIFGATRFANASSEKGMGTAKDSNYLMLKQIKHLKKNGFFVIPYFHWGYEYVRIPSPRERSIAHKCLDAGADLVIGSHPHIYQGIEEYKGKKIAYSLGNFIFHSSVFKGLAPTDNDPRLKESFVFSITINKNMTYSADVYGYTTDDDGVVFYNESENEKLKHDVKNVSQILHGSKIKYLKDYYNQSYEISKQNAKVRNIFLNIEKKSLKNKIAMYKSANTQDVKNRLVGFIFSLVKKWKVVSWKL